MDALLIRSQVGMMPADDITREWFSKLKLGATVLADVSQPRNPHFHRKFFALLKYAYDHWSETQPAIEYRGQPIQPDFERFRKDVTILAGKFRPVVNIKGEVRIEADSISFARMTEDQFQKLYSSVIQVLLARVFTSKDWDEDTLRGIVERLCEFA